MADEVRTEDTEKPEGKKLGITSKLPIDAILLVAIPFVVFVVLFLHVMGFLPPQPLRVNVIVPDVKAGESTQTGALQKPEGEALPESGQEQVSTNTGQTDNEALRTGQLEGSEEVASSEPISEVKQSQPEPQTDLVQEQNLKKDVGNEATANDDAEREAKLKQLAKVYEQMKASSVAAIVTNMSDEEAIEVLANMKPRNAAKVLAALDPERAAKLSRLLTE